jgi:predicted alpha/beta-hydrolase family hydrolase
MKKAGFQVRNRRRKVDRRPHSSKASSGRNVATFLSQLSRAVEASGNLIVGEVGV